MKKTFLVLLAFLTSCASSYHREGFFGDGYSEIITNNDSFIVSFKGNEYTSPETVLRYTLLRASELTMDNGYNYFVVLDTTDRSTSYNYSTIHSNASANANAEKKSKSAHAETNESSSITAYSGTTVKPATSIKIKCYHEKPDKEDAIDALFYWKNNRAD